MPIYKQPLLHFLVLGLLLFLLFQLTATTGSDPGKTIVVDREKLLTHLQFRSKSFNTGQFESTLDSMPPEQLSALIDGYVQEESLYREAMSLGLDANDYVIRQRLIQKVEYLASGSEPVAQANIEDFYEKNKDNYHVASTLTFTHVFINRENHESGEAARQIALNLLGDMLRDGTDFSGAMQFGDRFAFHKNYVDRTEDFIASHFGREIARTVSKAETGKWFGPVESAYGYHLVLVSDQREGRTPPLDSIIADVTYDAQQVASRQRTQNAIKDIVRTYDVVVDL